VLSQANPNNILQQQPLVVVVLLLLSAVLLLQHYIVTNLRPYQLLCFTLMTRLLSS
jgi:hypothetical protein